MSTWICLLTVSLGLLLAKQLAGAARDVLGLALSRWDKIKTAKQGEMVLVCDRTNFGFLEHLLKLHVKGVILYHTCRSMSVHAYGHALPRASAQNLP